MLPKFIKYDLRGYRGFEVVEIPLLVFERNKKWCATYSHHGAGWALETEWSDTKEGALKKLEHAIDIAKKTYLKYQKQ